LAVAKHSFSREHHHQLLDTEIITSVLCYMDQKIREVIGFLSDAVTKRMAWS
jgi:hypothetical protein